MHYYKRNIGDYHKKAGRLTLLQHGVYTVLMDAIYDREQFPTFEEAIDWTWASTREEVEAVEFILRKFFTNGDGVYIQKRIQEELFEYDEFCKIQAEKGKKGGRPKKPGGLNKNPAGLNKNPSEAGGPEKKPEKSLTTNHKPLTTNQIPKEINPTAWEEFEQHRREIRKPLSDLARTKAMNIIKEFSFDEQAAIIDKTIQNRWTGLFPERKNENSTRTSESNHARVMRRLAEDEKIY